MALLTPQQISIAGIAPTYAAAAGGGDTIAPDDRTFLHVKNGSGASITVTVVTPGTVGGLAIADLSVAVAAGADRMVGPLTAALFADPTTGLVPVTYSGVTSLTVAALRV